MSSMTQAEAIEVLENGFWWDLLIPVTTIEGRDAEDKLHEALDLALAALRGPTREMVERMRGEWRECFEDWRKQIAGDKCSKCGFQHYGTSINHYHFCPACGAPMTGEAVDMMLERWKEAVDGEKP